MKKFIVIIICLIFMVPLYILSVDEIDEKSQKLQELKKNKAKLESQRKNIMAKEKSVLLETKKIEKQLVIKEKELRTYELNLAQCEAEIERLTIALKEAEARAENTKNIMLKRLTTMYKLGYDGNQISYVKLLVGSENTSDLLNKYKYMSAIAYGDRLIMEKAAEERAEVARKRKQIEDRRAQILRYKQGTEKLKEEIAKKGEIRQKALADLRNSKANLTKTINELERSVKELESLIARLREKPQKYEPLNIDDLERMRGQIPWPTSGKIIPNSSPSMMGVTIQAPQGAEIRAVASGIVEYSQWFDGIGFGQMIIINHGKGYRTLYAHASELLVAKGNTVKKDQIIARVGSTGSFVGPILYFEIWSGTRALSTRQWLR